MCVFCSCVPNRTLVPISTWAVLSRIVRCYFALTGRDNRVALLTGSSSSSSSLKRVYYCVECGVLFTNGPKNEVFITEVCNFGTHLPCACGFVRLGYDILHHSLFQGVAYACNTIVVDRLLSFPGGVEAETYATPRYHLPCH